MEGAIELAEEVFHMSVRQGIPRGVAGFTDVVSNPIYATSVGLLQYAQRMEQEDNFNVEFEETTPLFERVKNWFKNTF